jgi:predicted GNAT superfamily acetyltransferase
MPVRFEVKDLHGLPTREALLDLNNASARETSWLTLERFDQMIESARVALFVPPAVALLLAFEQSGEYDNGHFLWFGSQFDRFLYVDRIVVAEEHRRHGLGRLLYASVFRRAAELGHTRIVCEVNLDPPNPASDRFHAALRFSEVGRATINNGAKTVRYLAASLSITDVTKSVERQGQAS